MDNHIKDFFKEKHNKEKLHQIQQNLTGKGCPVSICDNSCSNISC